MSATHIELQLRREHLKKVRSFLRKKYIGISTTYGVIVNVNYYYRKREAAPYFCFIIDGTIMLPMVDALKVKDEIDRMGKYLGYEFEWEWV